MHGGPRTKAEARRIEILKFEVGCLACHRLGFPGTPADYHHARHRPPEVRYHEWGYGLCPWHHRGMTSMHPDKLEFALGASLARNKHAFHRRFGTESELVALADRLLAEFEGEVV